ncbi:unnamed protein product [Musa textilis]
MPGDHEEADRFHIPFHGELSSLFSQKPAVSDTGSLGFDQQSESPLVNFTDAFRGSSMDYGVIARALGLSCPAPSKFLRSSGTASRELMVDVGNGRKSLAPSLGCSLGTTPVTPNSSISSSSTEAAGEEDAERCKKDEKKQGEEQKKQAKGDEEEGDKPKTPRTAKKKGEKRQREPAFAFVTKSEIDHLEDGYRWRKYGQKAVKNSPYPRSYYRCTTQKCPVKKRVERSYQDPKIVVTTYEGKHTHQSPAAVRGSTHLVAPPTTMPMSFYHDLVMHQAPQLSNTCQQGNINPNMYLANLLPPRQQLQFPEYGLLQDVLSSFDHGSQL